tara:strand:- start:6331 stop:6519 length:189 start_codon:yes stop_codon:yes gene_type:complete
MNLELKLLRLPQVIERYSLSESSIYRKRKSGNFPQPIALGDRAIAWKISDLEKWEKNLKEVV